MRNARERFSSLLIALAALLCSGTPIAQADDSEVFSSAALISGPAIRPNILFVIDTSGSMDSIVESYDPGVTYAGPCTSGRVFWNDFWSEQPPDCSTTTQYFQLASQRCAAATAQMGTNGWWYGVTQQFDDSVNQWLDARPGESTDEVECEADSGVHGPDAVSDKLWARDGGGMWSNNAGDSILWTGRQSLSLYSANYANWWYGTGPGARSTRLQVVRDVAKTLIDDLEGVNLGLMRYSNNGGSDDARAEGGMVTYPVSELTATSRSEMKALLDSYTADGYTPLSETYYEAHQYFAGSDVDYGDTSMLDPSTPLPSVAESRAGGSLAGTDYDTPMTETCQNNYIVYLTDGLPTADTGAQTKIEALPDFAADGGACATTDPNASWPGSGRCMVALARYLHAHDLRPSLAGRQIITTYMIGFGDDIAASRQYLDDIAAAGGSGQAYVASSTSALTTALEEIFTRIIEGSDVTFSSPTVSVNAFNRARNLDTLYLSAFSPSRGLHWPGNLKKYRVVNGEIVDANGDPAVDAVTGFIRSGSRSYWSEDQAGNPVSDGPEVTVGGASSQIPNHVPSVSGRKLYTYLGNATLAHTSNALVDTNALITDATLGIGNPGDPARSDVIWFARGQDLRDADTDGDTTERRMRIGDPMHARPGLVIYGGTAASPQGVVYVPTNDGYLHAFDSATGRELWAFVVPEFLPKLARLYTDADTPNRQYALDGDVSVFKYDVNGDGVVDPGDKVYLVFGFARGGSVYYALDVTDKTDPRLMWRRDPSDLPGLGKAWSPAQFARVNVSGATQNAGHFVAIIGGGYDESQENYVYSTDSIGNRIFMLDLESGALLWYAGNVAGANLNHAQMNNSIPARIVVLDTDGDRYADRMYAGDMGGRVWRFDITNGQTASTLVAGGVLAKLGAGGIAGALRADTRRFYNAPDVALIQRRGSTPFLSIAIGSGYRGHPLEADTQDRFYALRDYLPFGKRTQAQYDAVTPILDGDLVDITGTATPSMPAGAKGWKLNLTAAGSWSGEKVLAESVTIAGVVMFPSYQPLGEDPANACTAVSLNRAYSIRVDNGRAYTDMDEDGTLETSDRYSELRQNGIAPEIVVFRSDEANGGGGGGGGGGTRCAAGVETVRGCVNFGDTVRSFWQRQ